MPVREDRPSERELAIMREVSTRLIHHHIVDLDPEDPAQPLDDPAGFELEPLDVDAQAQEDLAEAAAVELPDEDDEEDQEPRPRETGDLYGVRTPHAADPAISAPEDQDAFEGADRGEHWLESLEEHAAEMGPQPEEPVVVIEESQRHHPSDHRDRPVADKGSGGPGGL
jgi:hypothetical protein